MIYICVPTFKETNSIISFFTSIEKLNYSNITVVIVNACPGDETSIFIQKIIKIYNFSILELHGNEKEYWSATVNRGLIKILQLGKSTDFILICNSDIIFEHGSLENFDQIKDLFQNFQIGALTISNNIVVSSGVIVLSWLLTLNKHIFCGLNYDIIPKNKLFEVNYLPTRFLLVSIENVRKIGIMKYQLLPHYGADYEFSLRLSKNGCRPFLYTGIAISSNRENTGLNIYVKETILLDRVKNFFSIKNPSNPYYRSIYILLSYPLYSIPTALLAYLLRSIIETILSGKQIKKLFNNISRPFK